MSKAIVNWEDVGSWKRLVASMLATGLKPDMHEVARYYGTTHGSIEWQLRKVKQDAKDIKAKVDGGGAAPATPKKTNESTPATPRSSAGKKDPLHTVESGRVTKPSTKKNGIKKESEEDLDLVMASVEDDDFN